MEILIPRSLSFRSFWKSFMKEKENTVYYSVGILTYKPNCRFLLTILIFLARLMSSYKRTIDSWHPMAHVMESNVFVAFDV